MGIYGPTLSSHVVSVYSSNSLRRLAALALLGVSTAATCLDKQAQVRSSSRKWLHSRQRLMYLGNHAPRRYVLAHSAVADGALRSMQVVTCLPP
jgi:hypothetical protein